METVIAEYDRMMKGKNCLYILKLPKITIGDCSWDRIYKFGITGNIGQRLRTHSRNLMFTDIVLVKDFASGKCALGMETTIKSMAELAGERVSIMGNTELIETSDIAKYVAAVYKMAVVDMVDSADVVKKDLASASSTVGTDKIAARTGNAAVIASTADLKFNTNTGDWYDYQRAAEETHTAAYEQLLQSMFSTEKTNDEAPVVITISDSDESNDNIESDKEEDEYDSDYVPPKDLAAELDALLGPADVNMIDFHKMNLDSVKKDINIVINYGNNINSSDNKTCPDCGKKFRDLLDLQRHKNRKVKCINKDLLPEDRDNPNRCKYCNRVFSNIGNRNKHLKNCYLNKK